MNHLCKREGTHWAYTLINFVDAEKLGRNPPKEFQETSLSVTVISMKAKKIRRQGIQNNILQ